MEIKTPSHRWQLSFDGSWPTAVVFLDDGRLVAGNRDGQLFVWPLTESESAAGAGSDNPPPDKDKQPDTPADRPPARELKGHTNAITQLVRTPDGKRVISSSLDRTLRIWDVDAASAGTHEVVLDRSRREAGARKVPKAERDGVLNAPGVQVELVESLKVLEGHKEWIRSLAISGDGRRLISGDDACRSIVWDFDRGAPVSEWTGYARVWVVSAALSPDGSTAFTAEFAGSRSSFDRPAAQARFWNADDGTLKHDLLKTWTPEVKDKDRTDSYGYAKAWGKLMKRGLVCAAFSADGKLLAVGQGGETDTGQIHLVDTTSGKIVRTLSGHRYGACGVAFSADSKYVLSCGRDTTVRICQVADGKEVAALGTSRGGQFKDWLHGLAVSPNQQLVAAADIAGFVHVWQVG